MKEKIKNLSNKKIVIISLSLFVLVLLLGLTYAYWSRTFNQTGENISTYDCFDISFSENTDGIAMENGYPVTDEEGLKSEAYEVTITNTCKTVASYNVVLNRLNTSTLDANHVKVAVNSDIRVLSETETTSNTLSNASEARIINTGILGSKETRTIKVRNWMDEKTSEEEGANKTFSYKITIEAAAGSKQLASLILDNNKLHTEKPSLNLSVTSKQHYNKLSDRLKTRYTTDSGLYIDADDYGNTYYFRGAVENNYVKFGNLKTENNQTIAEKYFYVDEEYDECIDTSRNEQWCNKKLGNDNNDMLWRIVRINGDNTIRLVLDNEIGTTKWDDNFSLEEQIGYTHKERTGKYKDVKLDNFSNNIAIGDSYYADSYSLDVNTGQYSLVNPILRTRQECKDNNSLCINKYTLNLSDVNRTNNIIFKLISIDDNTFNTELNAAKPIFNEKEINSTIKEKVDTWYEANLKTYEKNISTSTFCNDTTTSYFDSDFKNLLARYGTSDISFKCSDTNAEYGGKYNLKIGLLSYNEIRFAGIGSTIGSYPSYDMYLANIPKFWTMTPIEYRGTGGASQMYGFTNGTINRISWYSSSTDEIYTIRPVINLKSNVKVTGGDGTKNNPYVIE